MLKIINASLDEFYSDVDNKILVLYGAGKKARVVCDNWKLKNKVAMFVDKDLNKNVFFYGDEKIPIINMKEFLEIGSTNKNLVLLITPAFCAMEIIEELDRYVELDGIRTYVANLIEDCYEKQSFEFTKGEKIIPKKIHYCWFGKKEIPDKLKYCIDSWYKFCSDYEIIRWDENNYDVTKNTYMNEAYKCKKYGFVSDYAALDIVYREGGVYLDTDVELLSSLDMLLADEMFCGALVPFRSGFGLGFGAVKSCELIKQLRDSYEEEHFIDCYGKMNMQTCSYYQDPILKEYGFSLENKYQKINSIVYYPTEVLNPTGMSGKANNFTKKTIAIHHATVSWLDEVERINYVNYQKKIMDRVKYE